MKKWQQNISMSLAVLLCTGVATAADFKSEQEKESYAVGVNVARKLKLQGVAFDAQLLAQGVSDEMKGKSRLSATEVDEVLKKLQNDVRQRQVAEAKKAAALNQERGAAYLAEYAKKADVKTLVGGILYRVLQAGSGVSPENDSVVRCNYRGTLVDGTVFDASPAGKPATLEVAELIPGWRKVLQQMTVGSKWEVVIPAELAYGERGSAPAIGPNETLIFEIELVGIE